MQLAGMIVLLTGPMFLAILLSLVLSRRWAGGTNAEHAADRLLDTCSQLRDSSACVRRPGRPQPSISEKESAMLVLSRAKGECAW